MTRARLAVATWSAIVAVGVAIGAALNARGRNIVLPTPPLLGSFVDGIRPGVLLPAATGAVLVVGAPRMAGRLPWRRLLAVTPLLSLSWVVSLALAEGTRGFTRGPSDHTEYLTDVPSVRMGAGAFLRDFVAHIDRYEIHVRGHPPGMVLLLGALDRVGLGGVRWEAALIVGAAVTAPVAVLLVLRDVAGEGAARRACPWLVLAPAAVWVATSADALYMAVGAWAVACVVLATSAPGRRWVSCAAAAGVLWGLALLGSYGLVLLAAVPSVVLWSRRAVAPVGRAVAVATAATIVVLALPATYGFWWPAGLQATRHEYLTLDIDRPYWAFVLINLAAWAVALGPATAIGLAHLAPARRRQRQRTPVEHGPARLGNARLRAVVAGGVLAAALADLSGLSSGEVERIWLPFTIWVLPAGAAACTSARDERRGLALQVATTIVLISLVTTQW